MTCIELIVKFCLSDFCFQFEFFFNFDFQMHKTRVFLLCFRDFVYRRLWFDLLCL